MADDYDKLLADVERSLGDTGRGGGRGAHPTPAAETRPARRRGAGPTRAVRDAALAGAVAAAVVFVLFLFVPLLGEVSGAAGAFLATTVAVLLLRRR